MSTEDLPEPESMLPFDARNTYRENLWIASCMFDPAMHTPLTNQYFQLAREWCFNKDRAFEDLFDTALMAEIREGLVARRRQHFEQDRLKGLYIRILDVERLYLALLERDAAFRHFAWRASFLVQSIATANVLWPTSVKSQSERTAKIYRAMRQQAEPAPIPVGGDAHPIVDWILESSGGMDPGRQGRLEDCLFRSKQLGLNWHSPLGRFVAERCLEIPSVFQGRLP